MEDSQPQEGGAEPSRSTEGLAARLRRLVGKDVDPEITLDALDSSTPSSASTLSKGILRRLQAHGLKETRYVLKGEVARGGMGVILHAWDEDLRRDLAMKVVIDRERGDDVPADEIDPKTLCRFLEEAQITGQLDHPGVVPVHELGLDAAGHVYFTMRLVKGQTLKKVFQLVHDEEKGWTVTRALGVLMKVCEAMAYAHAKGVIHRDLKPANVMVGRFGEVYVMDWGLARVIGSEDRKDIRINRELISTPVSVVQSERRGGDGEASDEALVTMDGDVVGTPAYISPEQARGQVAELDARTDVYSIGCMLYQLLAGEVPFMPSNARIGPHMLLMRVLEGPPRPLAEVAPRTPAELVAICEKAMARDPKDRYWTAEDLAKDLQDYLDGRVVRAYESGAVAEIRKWVVRNRLAAAASFLALAAVIGGLFMRSEVEARNRRELHETTDVDRARAVLADAGEPWPSVPASRELFEEWLARADDLLARRDRHEERLAEFEALAAAEPDFDRRLRAERQRELLDDLDRLRAVEIARMEGRLAFALAVEERTVSGPDVAARWEEAIASIADAVENPHYRGLRIAPQLGLIPLGQDPVTKLWEFAHLETGAVPERSADGTLAVGPDTGLVLVLIPGGSFEMGAEPPANEGDPAAGNRDPLAKPDEGPIHGVAVEAFLLSKYEMTQGQWLRLTGTNPSTFSPAGRRPVTLDHPVETVSWNEVAHAMERLGLRLPSEAEWEYACRAGTTTPWWHGAHAGELARTGNVADLTLEKLPLIEAIDYEPWVDGFPTTAPVGSFAPNPYGLHDVHGNVNEWVEDRATESYSHAADERTDRRVLRGGSWKHMSRLSRSSFRHGALAKLIAPVAGVRPARGLDP